MANGRLKPQFVSTDDVELLDLAERFIAAYDPTNSPVREEIEELSTQAAQGFRTPKLAQGILKIIDDQAVFSSPQDMDYPAARYSLFKKAAEIIRANPGQTEEQYHQRLAQATADNPLAVRESIYEDLPENDRLVKLSFITPKQVLERYNCGLVQGLLLHAGNIQLTVHDTDPAKLRRLFKYLKFFRLLARISADSNAQQEDSTPDKLSIVIDGPASIFDQSKRYGFQLACFFPAVCALDHWSVRAEINWKDSKRFLVLDESTGLVSHYHNFTAYAPEEIQLFHNYFKEAVKDWTIVGNAPFIRGDGNDVIFPDFSFRHADGTIVHLELFHRWHATQVIPRLDWLKNHLSAPLVIGIDRFLLKDDAVKSRLETDDVLKPRIFLFSDYPTVDKTLRCLNAFL
jgi:predicted nuclease of restriction endonuclease-like RecB superfamily